VAGVAVESIGGGWRPARRPANRGWNWIGSIMRERKGRRWDGRL